MLLKKYQHALKDQLNVLFSYNNFQNKLQVK